MSESNVKGWTKTPTPPKESRDSQRLAQLRFLVTTGNEKLDSTSRRAIRSHVMLGKNTRKPRPVVQQRCIAAKERRLSARCTPKDDNSKSSESSAAESADGLTLETTAAIALGTRGQSTPRIPSPRNVGWNVGPLRIADEVDSDAVQSFLHFSSIAKHVLFLLEPYFFFDRRAVTWIAPLTFDAAFLHTMICTSRYYFEIVAPGKSSGPSKTTLQHYSTALALLRERMSREDRETALSDTTITALMVLTGHAFLTGNLSSVSSHVRGLHKIVGLRGGLEGMRPNTKVCIEILRCDLGLTLRCGSRPEFFSNASDRAALPRYPDLQPLLGPNPSHGVLDLTSDAQLSERMDQRLVAAWNALSDFCSVVRLALVQRKLISLDVYLDIMASTMYRLLDMGFPPGTWDETLRLGLLAFSSNILLQWQSLGITYRYLDSEFRTSLLKCASEHPSSPVLLWLLIVGATTMPQSTENKWLLPMIRNNLDHCKVEAWDSMRELMISMLWVESVHDRPARKVVGSVLTRDSRVNRNDRLY